MVEGDHTTTTGISMQLNSNYHNIRLFVSIKISVMSIEIEKIIWGFVIAEIENVEM